jgi:arylsulfatase A-like enzyme
MHARTRTCTRMYKGLVLSQYYTFKLCSPTRASLQSGRYPWGVGFYDMDDVNFEDGNHCVRYSLFGRSLQARMCYRIPLVPTLARVKLSQACG